MVQCCLLVSAEAQEENHLRFKRLNIQDGLPSSVTTDLAEDQRGLLWIGTFSGLASFDGTEFTNYPADKSPCGLATSKIRHLSVGPDSNVYLIAGAGWSMLDVKKQCFQNFQVDTTNVGLPNQFLQGIYADTGVVWFGTAIGVAKYDLESKRYQYFETPANEELQVRQGARMRQVLQHPSDPDLLVLAFTGGICHFRKSSETFEFPVPIADAPYWGRSLPRFLAVFDSTYWNGWWGNSLGRYNIHRKQWTFYYTEEGKRHIDAQRGKVPYDVATGVLPFGAGSYLVGFERGLGVLSLENGGISLYQNDPHDITSLSDNRIEDIIRTASGVIYAATSNGISILEQALPFISRYDPREQLKNEFGTTADNSAPADLMFYCARIPLDDRQLLYSDAQVGGMTLFNYRSGSFRHIPLGTERGRPIVLYDWTRFDEDRVLCGSEWGLRIINTTTLSNEPLPSYLDSLVQHVGLRRPVPVKMQDGTLFIWDWNKVIRIGSDHRSDQMHPTIFDDALHITTAGAGPNNRLYAWYNFRGYFSQGDSLHPIPMSHEPESAVTAFMYENDHVWLGTGGSGLLQYRVVGDSLRLIKQLTTADGLPSNDVSRLASKSMNGHLWGTTLSGVFRYDLNTSFVRAYDVRDGIELAYIDEPPVLFPDGTVVFDDRRYWYRIDPETDMIPVARPYIRRLEFADSAYFDVTNRIVLPPHQNTVTIEMGIIDHVNGRRDELFFWLEGFDENWQKAGKDRNARYTNLKPGSYRMRVRSRNPEGVYSEPVHASFVIKPAVYQQPWFVPLLIVIGLGTIYLWYRSRIRSIKQKELAQRQFNQKVAELELKALRSQMNPHFMFNSLNSIKNYILRAEPQKASEYLSSFAHLIRLMLQHSREKSVTLQDELEALLLYIDLEKLRFRDGFEFQCSVDDAIDLDTVTIPPMILQPYVENAIWHGLLHKEDDRRLSINFNKINGQLHCSIEDNGIGRDKAGEIKSKSATRYKSMGMGITRDRLDILNQMNQLGIEVEIIDKQSNGQPAGTRVDIKIPYESNSH